MQILSSMLEGGMKRNARMIECLLVWFEVSIHTFRINSIFSSAGICVSRKTFFWLRYFSNKFYMRLIIKFNE